ncbi:hypothetical protein EJ04DRAFT_587393 [Polyplosphaeria fusca]|uniref:Uncharacterized protein n=1 Tax=Polyplosphaeria fusca TaxID=682080 RepID=A0A9P4QNY4_9PLEO|nr:hypothetical protein EJ04DRAFT_587393 [Polyplosphaeria fusca]
MIETIKDMKRGKETYESLNLERTASQILHQMEDKEDNLESTKQRVLANARAIYGPTRHLDIISFAPTSSRRITAAIVEHNPTGRSYIHCCSAKEGTRLAAMEHLLVITEDVMQRLIDKEGVTSSGWLPATPQVQHAINYAASVCGESAVGSVVGSRRGSVQPIDGLHVSPHYSGVEGFQKPGLVRNNSDHHMHQPRESPAVIPRTNSEIMLAPKPVPVGRFPGGQPGRMQWHLGSEG